MCDVLWLQQNQVNSAPLLLVVCLLSTSGQQAPCRMLLPDHAVLHTDCTYQLRKDVLCCCPSDCVEDGRHGVGCHLPLPTPGPLMPFTALGLLRHLPASKV